MSKTVLKTSFWLTGLAIALISFSSPSMAQTPVSPGSEIADALRRGVPHVTNEVLVQFRIGSTPERQARILGRLRVTAKEVVVRATARNNQNLGDVAKGDLVLARLPAGLGVAQAIGALAQDQDVVFVEPNWIYQHQATSDDTHYVSGNLWGMYGASSPVNVNINGSAAGMAWGAGSTDCSSVYVGIIDEGYMYTHEDLAANAGMNPREIAGNRVDDDGNGYVDDIYGWDFDGRNDTIFDGVGDDHGTHVAGTIGGVGKNGMGVAGICWSVKLMGAKFLGSRGGTTANAILAVDYFTDLKSRNGVNLVATNNSWGGGGYSQGLFDAIERANSAGILFVAAAGNSGVNIDTSPSYPAAYSNANIISVAAITKTGAMASFSNFGKTRVDLGAPGSDIVSTVPARVSGATVSRYTSYSGTSMAAPHVTGAVALYAARNPSATAAAIKAAILSSVTSLSSLNNKTVTGGRLNVSGF